MPSEVDLCSTALLKLGDTTIMELGENSQRAKLARLIYPEIRDAVQRVHPWKCCTFQRSLARLSDAPAFGYAYQFQLPSDPYCLRVLYIDGDPDRNLIPYKIVGRKLHCDELAVDLWFIGRVVDPNAWDSLLVEAIIARLMVDLAYPVTSNPALSTALFTAYQLKVGEAGAVDLDEDNQSQVITDNPLVDARDVVA
jgi:hypothetical protein